MYANNRAYILGLTGGIACGKSTVAAKLAELGAIHVDADAITHQLMAPGGEAVESVRQVFGEGAVLPDGSVDRQRLGAIVFEDGAARRALEGIVHPLVQRKMLEQVDAASPEDVVLLDVPLLFETGMDTLCDEVWVVAVPHEKQLERLLERGRLTREEAELRMAAQMSTEDRVARANAVFSTDKPLERTLAEVASQYANLQKKLKDRE